MLGQGQVMTRTLVVRDLGLLLGTKLLWALLLDISM